MVFAVIAVRRAAPIFEKMQGFIDRMNVVLRENIIGVRVIRAFGKERHEEGRMGRVFSDYANAAIKVNWIFAGVDCFSFCLMNIAEVLLHVARPATAWAHTPWRSAASRRWSSTPCLSCSTS